MWCLTSRESLEVLATDSVDTESLLHCSTILDFNLNTPMTTGHFEDLVLYVRNMLYRSDAELLLMVDPGVYDTESWLQRNQSTLQHNYCTFEQ